MPPASLVGAGPNPGWSCLFLSEVLPPFMGLNKNDRKGYSKKIYKTLQLIMPLGVHWGSVWKTMWQWKIYMRKPISWLIIEAKNRLTANIFSGDCKGLENFYDKKEQPKRTTRFAKNKTEKSVQSKTTRSKSPSVSRLRKTALLKCW
jgi:hypothetical protein